MDCAISNSSKKYSLLPRDGIQDQCKRCVQREKAKPRRIILWTAFTAALFLLIKLLHERKPHEPSILNMDQKSAFSAREPSIPWAAGQTVYVVPADTYRGLQVKQEGNQHIIVTKGNVYINVNQSLAETTVRFDIKVPDELDQGHIEIRQFYPEETDVFGVAVDAIYDNPHHPRLCINLDIRIDLPSAAILDILDVGISNSVIEAEGPLQFRERLTLAVANGNILIKDIKSGRAVFTTANGIIQGHLRSLADDLTANTANGNIDLSIASITASPRISLGTSNGDLNLSIPDTVNSEFNIKTVLGKVNVEATEPVKLHFTGPRRSHHVRGYYGDEADNAATVKLASVVGKASLRYV